MREVFRLGSEHGAQIDLRSSCWKLFQSMLMRQQAMAGGQIDDAPAAEHPAHAPGHLPSFVQLFSRQARRVTHGARDAVEERLVRKTIDVPIGQASAGRVGEHGSDDSKVSGRRAVPPCYFVLKYADSSEPSAAVIVTTLRSASETGEPSRALV